MMNSELIACPNHLLVIGGGRWARVLTEALTSVIPPTSRITIYTEHNADQMSEWADAKGYGRSISVTSDWPCFEKVESTAAIVVNSARDHERVTRQLLRARVPVLSEKPVAQTAESTKALIDLAYTNETYLAAANIFLFTDYIENCAELLTGPAKIKNVSVCWTDPVTETRYGECKRYDPGLPIIADVYPHIMSILSFLIPGYYCDTKALSIKKGGSIVKAGLLHAGVPCQLQVARNGRIRQREIEIRKSDGTIQLDFSNEPGWIRINDKEIPAPADRGAVERASTKMIRTFLRGVESRQHDSKLDIRRALYANHAIDQAMESYKLQQKKWVLDKCRSGSDLDQDLKYVFAEILQEDGLLSDAELKIEFARLHEYYLSADHQNV